MIDSGALGIVGLRQQEMGIEGIRWLKRIDGFMAEAMVGI